MPNEGYFCSIQTLFSIRLISGYNPLMTQQYPTQHYVNQKQIGLFTWIKTCHISHFIIRFHSWGRKYSHIRLARQPLILKRKKNLWLTQKTDKKVIWHRFSRISIFIPVCLSFGDHRKKRRCPPVVIVMARQQAAAKQRPALPLRSSYYTNIVIALWHFAPYHPLHRNSMLR